MIDDKFDFIEDFEHEEDPKDCNEEFDQ